MKRYYDAWRSLVEQKGGSMVYERKSRPQYGAWVIRLRGRVKVIPASGKASFPDLDRCYEPKVPNPKTYFDYHGEESFNESCAQTKLINWFGA